MTIQRTLEWRAVAKGAATDIVATLVLGLIASVAIGVAMAAGWLPPSFNLKGTGMLLFLLALGLGCVVAGAWVAARAASARPYLHGLLVGAWTLPLGVFGWQSVPLWYALLSCVGSIAAGWFGGHLGRHAARPIVSFVAPVALPQSQYAALRALSSQLPAVLVEAMRTLLWRQPHWSRVHGSPALIGLLVGMQVLMLIGMERLMIVGAADFYWRALASGWFGTCCVAWACYLLRAQPDHQAAPSTAQVLTLIFAQTLVSGAVLGALFVLEVRSGSTLRQKFDSQTAWLVWLAPYLWLLSAQLPVLVRGVRLPRVRIGLAIVVASAGFAVNAVTDQTYFWYAAQTPVKQYPRLVLSQETMEAQQALLASGLAKVLPQRPGVIDLYAITFAPYAEAAEFRNESTMVAEVMRKRFDSGGRTLQLLNHNETAADIAWATPLNLQRAITRFAQVMDRDEDVFFLYMTSHGARDGQLAASFWPLEVATLTPATLKKWLDAAGIRHRVIVVSACYSGTWVNALADDNTLVMTAADADHTSYGCGNKSDLTFFGRAMFDEQLRVRTRSFEQAHRAARDIIRQRESDAGKEDGYSNPQIRVGSAIRIRLAQLEQRLAAPAK